MALGILASSSAIVAAQPDEIGSKAVTRLILRAEPGLKDAGGWARDLLKALSANEIQASRENVCAAIAVIDQESSFVANPTVPGLGRMSENALRAEIGKLPVVGPEVLAYLDSNPTVEDSYLKRIRKARTERDLDLVYREFVEDAGRRSGLGSILGSGVLNGVIEQQNKVSTIGSMQVAVAFAVAEEKGARALPMSLSDVYQVRDRLYTREGGLYYGVRQLLRYESGYSRKIHRFADYNAGRYASRNAAFQAAIAKLGGAKLSLDGDLLSYNGRGEPQNRESQTEKLLQQVSRSLSLPLDKRQIREDLLKEKAVDFTETKTFKLVRQAYKERFGAVPDFAVIPEITLSSIKIRSKMTTATFATAVYNRYQRCMAS